MDRSGRLFRSIFPETGFIVNSFTRKILLGTDGSGKLPCQNRRYAVSPLRRCRATSDTAPSRTRRRGDECDERFVAGSRERRPRSH